MSKKLRVNVHLNPAEVLGKDQNISINVENKTSWADVSKLIKEKVNNSLTSSLAFQYLDDEADYISGCTEEEWQAAIVDGSTTSRDELVLHIKVLPIEEVTKTAAQLNIDGSSTECCSSDPQCCYDRPMPENPVYDGRKLKKVVNSQCSEYKYADEALRAVTLHLGPIGGGCIALAGDGGLRQWQVSNEINHLAHVPHSFFAIRVDDESSNCTRTRVLQSNSCYDCEGFVPAPIVTDHIVPEASKALLNRLPGVKRIEITAKYPIAEVDIPSNELPVDVHLEAFNPCIPHNTKDSAIPMIIFNYTVKNPTDKKLKVTMLSSLLNFVGWDGLTEFMCEKFMPGTPGGNTNTLFSFGGQVDTNGIPEYKNMCGYYGLYMNNSKLDCRCSTNGELSIGVFNKTGDMCKNLLQFSDCYDECNLDKMWSDFTGKGLSGKGKPGASEVNKTWSGAISCCREIPPNESETFTFVLSWHFPYRYCKWGQWSPPAANSKTCYYLGNYYNTIWKDVHEVVTYTGSNLGRLTTLTRTFRDCMYDSTLPWHMVDSAAGRLSVIRSPSFMWCEDGNLYCFEGCSTKSGCCPMNCTHVLNYEMGLARCFPSLERKMRNIDLLVNMAPNAIIPSRTTMPVCYKREWEDWNWCNKDNVVNLSSTRICLDGDLGTVLKAYREIRHSAPEDFVKTIWPKIKAMMSRYMNELDKDKLGLLTGPQPCTYDRATYGIDTFIGGLYLCALRAAEEMAKLMGEMETAAVYHARFLVGSKNLDEYCFVNGKWYTQVTPQLYPVQSLGCGTFIDALIGQWWSYFLGLGPLLPVDHIRSHLKYVFERNHVEEFDPATQKPRKFYDNRDAGLHITYWDVEAGEKVPNDPLLYSFEGAWSGLEHTFAGLLLYEKMLPAACQVLEECRQKYDGTRRSPWNEIECGDHYCRALGAFLHLDIGSGLSWDILAIGEEAIELNFAPLFNHENFKSFFIVASGWGCFSQTISDGCSNIKLQVSHGEAQIVSLGLVIPLYTYADAFLYDEKQKQKIPIKTAIAQVKEKIVLTFPEAPTKLFPKGKEHVLTVVAGKSLEISFHS
ncbi:uncharacterized protein LOC124436960 [Xenia sp. Carnegie-2017]|uniref:uncharacterized protein LOC124436960 n=1 Tax=Xenia sp. Carnegie-2017 TaxID=2897299 RepID=UPI001F0377EC|nr:uncharacterized protein LOC124436960 [Xenia sp. Carnegie-2017]